MGDEFKERKSPIFYAANTHSLQSRSRCHPLGSRCGFASENVEGGAGAGGGAGMDSVGAKAELHFRQNPVLGVEWRWRTGFLNACCVCLYSP